MKNKPKTICNICGHGYGRWRYHYTTSSGEHVCRPCGDRENLRCQVDCIVVEHSAPVPQNSIRALRELRRFHRDNYRTQIGGMVDRLRQEYPGAPDRMLRTVAEYGGWNGKKARWNRRAAERIDRRIKRTMNARAKAPGKSE